MFFLLMAKIKNFLKRINITWDRVISAFLAVVFTVAMVFDSAFFQNQLLSWIWILNVVLWGSIFLVVMIIAGFTVLGAFIHASVGLTLLIFLGQTYCDLPEEAKSDTGMSALSLLMVVGLLYIFYEFGHKFIKLCKKHSRRLGRGEWKTIDGILTIVLFSLCVALFAWAIYQVVNPIVRDLCIINL